MIVLESIWFSTLKGTCGIIIIEEDVTHDRKAYIGIAEYGIEKLDIDGILAFGATFPRDIALRIAHKLKPNSTKSK